MALLKAVQNGEFLSATLDLSLPFEAGEWQLENGVLCQLTARGVLTVIPPGLSAASKDIVISSGVHGDETGPIELLQQLVKKILLGDLMPEHRLLLIIGHPEAINAHTRFIDENMNRLFGGINDEKNVDCSRANLLQCSVDAFFQNSPLKNAERWHLDLHSAIRDSQHYTFAVSPFSEHKTRGLALFNFLHHGEIEAMMLSGSAAPTFSWYSAQNYGAQALTMELGKVARLGENDLERLDTFNQAMLALVSQQSLPDYQGDKQVCVYRVTRTLTKHTDQFAFTFPANQANFTYFEEGAVLGSDNGEEYVAAKGGESVVFPNPNVALGQRACLLVKQSDVDLTDQVVAKF
ncbi:succinylglutamate desuccinylase [Photobacterium sp. 2_MG-2023]|uniref:succinylglutamate desuccinylase n=1 Tax=Photobacterium sp. 2_MG-2023 TaxID=3062663 RepID=UPI0026E37D75|nr:succinylglutamate desuccinylase [Photobacterium sp. 2_MG-2023]MDO6582328.1 succinylglutamate desuccinylase [Photobacterium sp. 2_MG-2023]